MCVKATVVYPRGVNSRVITKSEIMMLVKIHEDCRDKNDIAIAALAENTQGWVGFGPYLKVFSDAFV